MDGVKVFIISPRDPIPRILHFIAPSGRCNISSFTTKIMKNPVGSMLTNREKKYLNG
jgi:hypothetical protein